MTHIQTVAPATFEGIRSGEITCEIRRIKGPINEGDRIIYQESRIKGQQTLTGQEVEAEIVHVQKKNAGLRTGFALILFRIPKKTLNLNPDFQVNLSLPVTEEQGVEQTLEDN